MGAKAAGNVFWAFFLVLFPVAVQLSSHGCVTYKRTETCGIEGSSVEFPCSYSKNVQVISISGWSKQLHQNMKPIPLKHLPANSSRMNHLGHGKNDCTINLTDLTKRDAAIYYFMYSFRTFKGHCMTCNGVPGVKLHIFASPVSILVEKLDRKQDVLVADWTVMEGERIRLTCASTCAANLNSNLGYIWYKNTLQLNDSRANSPFLSLDPISNNDSGRYVCAMIGYKDLPSSVVNFTVRRSPRHSVGPSKIPGSGSNKDSVPTLTHDCDAQNATDQIFNKCPIPNDKSVFTFSIIIVASVCTGWVIAIMVTILVLKKKNKSRRCAGSVAGPPDPNCDSYVALDINSISAEYDTLDTVRHCSATDTVYENIHDPGNFTR